MQNIGIVFQSRGFRGPSQLAKLAGEIEDSGVDHLLVTESSNDAFTALAAIAGQTKRAQIGSGIANIYLRHPVNLAMAAASVEDISNGRLLLGVGTGHQITNEVGLGLDMSKPLGRMRDFLTIVRAVLDSGGQPVEAVTKRYRVSLQRIPWTPVRRVPIIVAALSDGMVRLAGTLADGVILSLATPRKIREVRALLSEAAIAAGRSPDQLKIYATINTVVRPTREEAISVLQAGIATSYRLPFYQRELDAENIQPKDGVVTEAEAALLGIAGRIEEIPDQIERFREAGVDVPCLSPFVGPEEAMIEEYRAIGRLAGG